MPSLDQIVRQAINPFDPATFKPGNFWYDQPDLSLEVDAIHQDAVDDICRSVDAVVADHRTRTLVLAGDSGSGKSYLLGRIKRTLSDRASFVYIDPFPDSQAIWRHILRYTVDSLVQTPEGQPESQLLRWLKQLSVLDAKDTKTWGKFKRQRIINKLKTIYPAGIYQPNEFFGALYDLLNPNRYALACEWLRGDDVDDEGLAMLQIQSAISTEDAAQKVLANFGRIAADTQPIILCFDQLDNIARTPDGTIDLQAIFNVNSSVHNQGLHNLLVIISIITSTWRQESPRVQASDHARIDQQITLRSIPLAQAAALWEQRLKPLHREATPAPDSPLAPFTHDHLEHTYPGGKTHPRHALEVGRRLFQQVKQGKTPGEIVATAVGDIAMGDPGAAFRLGLDTPTPINGAEHLKREDTVAAFRLMWRQELTQTQGHITRLRQLSAPALMTMLQEILAVLNIDQVRSRLLPSQTYANCSISYAARPNQNLPPEARVGLVWNDDPNMTTFYHVMNACRRVVALGLCHTLYLIRSGPTGQSNRKSHQLYRQIFDGHPHQHVRVTLLSIHYLATYHSLVNAVHAQELVVNGLVVNIQELESLMRKARILRNCRLLQDLGLVWGRPRPAILADPTESSVSTSQARELVQEFLLDLIKTHRLLGVSTLCQTASDQFPDHSPDQIHQLLRSLYNTQPIHCLDPHVPLDAQLVCWTD